MSDWNDSGLAKEALLIVTAGFAAIYGVKWAAGKIAAAAPKIGAALNPTSSSNLASKAVESIITQAVGHEESLGTWIYEKLHPSDGAAVATPPADAVTLAVGDYVGDLPLAEDAASEFLFTL